MKLSSNLDLYPEDSVRLHARDVAQILRIGTSTVFKYYREGKLSGKKRGDYYRSRIDFTIEDLAEFLQKVYLHDPDSATRTARRLVKELRRRRRQSFQDRFKLKGQG